MYVPWPQVTGGDVGLESEEARGIKSGKGMDEGGSLSGMK